MYRKDITRWAQESEFHVSGRRVLSPVIEGSDLTWFLERFAALAYAAGAAAEREACAKVCNQLADDMRLHAQWGANTCATAIRAMGNK